MKQPTTNEILDLISGLVLPFHEIKRTHKLPIGARRRENDVEHSWTVAVLACSLAPHIDPSLDIGKIAQFALVHDLVETFAGDTGQLTASNRHRQSKAEREHEAFQKIQKKFVSFPWLSETIAEYETTDSQEAKFVYAVDKYIAVIYDLIDNGLYAAEIGIDKPKYDKLMANHRDKAHRHSEVGKFYDEIRQIIDTKPGFLAPSAQASS